MSDKKDILDRLSGDIQEDRQDNDATPIPVRVNKDPSVTAEEALRRAELEEQMGRDIVREYQEMYYSDNDTSRRRIRAEQLAQQGRKLKQKVNQYDWRPHSEPMDGLTDDDRLWAALSHISFLVTAGAAIVTGGWAVLLMVFVPLAIYFSFRDKSDFIAFHALQAFAGQVLVTVGWVALLVVGIIVLVLGIVVSAMASVVLIGIPFLIVFVILLVAFILVMVAVPFAAVVLSLVGAISTYNSNNFRYPFIANWVDRQMDSGAVSL